jgi:hypothetical protein
MKKLLDLRFVIGLFFFIVGVLLTIYFILNLKQKTNASINIKCGVSFVVFGVIMIFLSYIQEIKEE